jgi:hypothetical protein
MKFINGGVYDHEDNTIETKKQLTEIIKDDPGLVRFYPTSRYSPTYEGRLNRIPKDITLVVCGPNPYTKRQWFANITRDPVTDHVRIY